MLFLPEAFLILVITFQSLYFIRIIINPKNNFPIIDVEAFSSSGFALLCTIFLLQKLCIEGYSIDYSFYSCGSYTYIKVLLVCFAYCLLQIIFPSFVLQKLNFAEFFTFFLVSVLSLFAVLTAQSLLALYLAVELQALCFYVLATFTRNSAFSVEAGLKYFITGSFISGCFLLGSSFIYSGLGTINLLNISTLLPIFFQSASWEQTLLVCFGICLITGTLLVKLACAPFHAWAPDVYDGAPLSSTLVFSILPKISLVFFFIKWIFVLNAMNGILRPVLLFVAVFSCLIGTVFGLYQTTLKRLTIYSSIAQIGFIVACISLNSVEAFTYAVFFLIIYIITAILLWGHIVIFYSFQYKAAVTSHTQRIVNLRLFTITSLAGFWLNNDIWALSFLTVLLSVAGIPPFAGFLAKVFVLLSLVEAGEILVASTLIVFSALSVFYYLRVLKVVFFEPTAAMSIASDDCQVVFSDKYSRTSVFIFVLLLTVLIFLIFFPLNLYVFCQYIILQLFN